MYFGEAKGDRKDSFLSLSQEASVALEKIDKEMESKMLYAEDKCRELNANYYDFSPPVKKWLHQCHLYEALIRLSLEMENKQTWNPKSKRLRCLVLVPPNLGPAARVRTNFLPSHLLGRTWQRDA